MEITFNLGGIERPKDERDFDLDRILGAVAAPQRPASYVPDIKSWLQRNWQQQQPACGPHSGSHLKNILDFMMLNPATAQGWGRKTPRYGWIKLKDPNSPVKDGYAIDQGTDMRSIFKWLQQVGADDFLPLGNDASLAEADYANPAAVTPDMDANAAESKIGSYAFGATDYESICQQVWQAKAVLLLIKCDEGFWHTTDPTFTTPKYGHFICAYGYDETGIWVIDSADPDDLNAFKHIEIQYIQPQFVLESGTAIDLPPSVHDALSKGDIATAQQILANMTKILELDLEWIKRKVGTTITA